VYNKKVNHRSVKQCLTAVREFARSGVKTASIGGRGDDGAFEQAFSNLAHAYLRDAAPRLLDHEVGFQLLDRNQENTKAVGVFAFKLGSNWLYAPVFFLNGDLKGHELLYIKNQDMFVPLKENWVNYLMNRKPNILGSGVDKNLTGLGQRQPDFTQLSRSPAKFGSAQPTLKEMMAAVMPTLAKTATMNTRKAFEELGESLHLEKFLKSARLETLDMLVKMCQTTPKIAAAFDEFHGLKLIAEATKLAKERAAEKSGKSILSKEAKDVGKLDQVSPSVVIQRVLPPGASEEDQEKLLQDGILIRDRRGNDEVSVPYTVQVERALFNPSSSGLYDVLVKSGEIVKCYIAVHPQGAGRQQDFVTVVRVEGKPDWLNTRADKVFCLRQIEGEEFNKWYDGLSEANSLGSGRYMILNRAGAATVPVRKIKEHGKTGQDVVVYEVHLEDGTKYPAPAYIRPGEHRDPIGYNKYEDGVRLHLKGNSGSKLRCAGPDIFVPEGFKLLTVSKGEDDTANAKDQNACHCGESDPPALMPGNIADAQLLLMQKLSSLTIVHNGTDVQLNDVAMTPKEALVSLVTKQGLREKAAKELLQTARTKRKFVCSVKYASPYGPPMMINDAPSAPAIPGPVMGGESIMGTSIPTQLGIDQGVPVDALRASNTDRSIYNPNTQFDRPSAVSAVVNAASTGQREVFDTAMVGSLLRAVRDDGLVDRYMGDLAKGLDKLGRILFMFYWHGDRFADRYGKADMPELEDSLRNAFEMLGDVILFLKQKTIEPFSEEESIDVDLGGIAGAS